MEYQQDMEWARIKPSPLNPRKHFDPTKLQELAASMENGVGIIEPLVVRPRPDLNAYELVAGERRWRAAEIAGLEKVPVVVKELTDAQVLEIMVIENNQRDDITPLEEAAGFQMLLKLENTGRGEGQKIDVDALAQRLGRSRKYVYDRIKLLALIPEAQALLATGRITAGHAILLARLTADQQRVAIDPKAAAEAEEGGLFRYSWNPPDDADLADGESSVAAGKGKKKKQLADPYRGLELAPVRNFQEWIRDNVRLKLDAAETRDEFPGLAGALEKAETVVHITHAYGWEPGGDDAVESAGPKIYDVSHWKRADGRPGAKTCPAAVTGVVVVGRERGSAFPVCIDKACKVHWPPAPKSSSSSASSSSGPSAKDRERARQREEAARAKIDRANARWLKAIPAVAAALAAKVITAKPSVLAALVIEGYNLEREWKRAGELLKSKPTDGATAMLHRLGLAALLFRCTPGVFYMNELARKAKRIGVDVKAIVTRVQTSAQAETKKTRSAKSKTKAAA